MMVGSEREGTTVPRASWRTCVGCRAEAPRGELLRLVLDGDRFAVDRKGTLGGRGVHVHARRSCIQGACRSGFSRALRRETRVDARVLVDVIVDSLSERLGSLVLAARRARAVTVGTDVTVEAVRAGKVALLVVARDARAAAEVASELAPSVPLGIVRHGDKSMLGRALGKDEVGLVGIVGVDLARSISEAATAIAGLTEDE